MPNKYEREIEEILRNMDRPEPKPGLGNRIRAFNRPRPRRPRHFGAFGLTALRGLSSLRHPPYSHRGRLSILLWGDVSLLLVSSRMTR